MSRRRLVSLAAFVLLTACQLFSHSGTSPQNGMSLPPGQLPTTDELKTTLKVDDVLYIEDDTYAPDPSLLIGKVFEIDRQSGSCETESPEGRAFFIDRISGYPITPRSSPVLRGSHVVNKNLAASISLLSYLSASLDDSALYSVVVTDEDIQRANDADATYATARRIWIANHGSLMTDPRVCWLALVDGVVHKTVVRRHFTKNQSKATAGAFGINIGGSYYVSDESYQLDHRFGLSPSILKRPARGPACLRCPEPLVDRGPGPTEQERALLEQLHSIPARPARPN